MASSIEQEPSLPVRVSTSEGVTSAIDSESFVDPTGTQLASEDAAEATAEVKPTGAAKVAWYRKEYGGPPKVKPEIIMEFSRQLGSFIEAGIPLIDALEIVGMQTGSDDMGPSHRWHACVHPSWRKLR